MITEYKVTFAPNPLRRHSRGKRGKPHEGITAEQNDFDLDAVLDDRNQLKRVGKARDRHKQELSFNKSFRARGARGEFKHLRGAERRNAIEANARMYRRLNLEPGTRRERVSVTGEGTSRQLRRFMREEGFTHRRSMREKSKPAVAQAGISLAKLKDMLRRFRVFNELPDMTASDLESLNRAGVNQKQFKRMLNAMRLASGVEPDPGPYTDCECCSHRDDHYFHGRVFRNFVVFSKRCYRSHPNRYPDVNNMPNTNVMKMSYVIDMTETYTYIHRTVPNKFNENAFIDPALTVLLNLNLLLIMAGIEPNPGPCPNEGTFCEVRRYVRRRDGRTVIYFLCEKCSPPYQWSKDQVTFVKEKKAYFVLHITEKGKDPVLFSEDTAEPASAPPVAPPTEQQLEPSAGDADGPPPLSYSLPLPPDPKSSGVFVTSADPEIISSHGGHLPLDGIHLTKRQCRGVMGMAFPGRCFAVKCRHDNVIFPVDSRMVISRGVNITEQSVMIGTISGLNFKFSLAPLFLVIGSLLVVSSLIMSFTVKEDVVRSYNVTCSDIGYYRFFTVLRPVAKVMPCFVHMFFGDQQHYYWHQQLEGRLFLNYSIFFLGFMSFIVCAAISRLRLKDILIPLRWKLRQVSYVPHIVSSVVSEYSIGTCPEVVYSSVRTKISRLSTIPLPDRYALQLIAGSDIAVKVVVAENNFFADRLVPPRPASLTSIKDADLKTHFTRVERSTPLVRR